MKKYFSRFIKIFPIQTTTNCWKHLVSIDHCRFTCYWHRDHRRYNGSRMEKSRSSRRNSIFFQKKNPRILLFRSKFSRARRHNARLLRCFHVRYFSAYLRSRVRQKMFFLKNLQKILFFRKEFFQKIWELIDLVTVVGGLIINIIFVVFDGLNNATVVK